MDRAGLSSAVVWTHAAESKRLDSGRLSRFGPAGGIKNLDALFDTEWAFNYECQIKFAILAVLKLGNLY